MRRDEAMTKEEAERMLEYEMIHYPGFRLGDDAKRKTVLVLAAEFKNQPLSRVVEAFKMASEQSLDRPPSLPRIKAAIAEIEARIRPDPETDYDGLSKEEQASREAWFSTDEGKRAMELNKERIRSIIKGMRAIDE